MVSTKYLGGKRMTDYAYAMTMLQNIQEQESAATVKSEGNKDLKTVFGDTIRAGQRFSDLKDQVAGGKTCAIVASDFTKALSVDGGDYADAPMAFETAPGTGAISIQSKGEEKPTQVTVSTPTKILFIQDGFSPFGKVAFSSTPGAIEVSASLDRVTMGNNAIKASLDGGNEVDLPHVFENVSAGKHTLVIANVYAGDKAFTGLQEEVTVEPGKRSIYDRTLMVGKGRLRITDIPNGSSLLIDGEEQTLTNDASGSLLFEGEVDAGNRIVEVVNGNKKWHADYTIVEINGSSGKSLKSMHLLTTLQRKSVKLKGKMEDWDGVETIFGPAKNPEPSKLLGSIIAGGTACRDDKSIFVRIDFANGKPDFSYRDCWRILQLFQTITKKRHVDLDCSVWTDGTVHPGMWAEESNRYDVCGSYVVGPSFIEMQFSLSYFSKYFDFSKPIQADVGFGTRTHYWNGSPQMDILIGD
jgi:hypothetical protein